MLLSFFIKWNVSLAFGSHAFALHDDEISFFMLCAWQTNQNEWRKKHKNKINKNNEKSCNKNETRMKTQRNSRKYRKKTKL